VLGQRIAAPADLAKILAAQSSEAKKALPGDRRFGSCATRGASQREDRPMARGASQVDFEAALQDPQAFFAEPQDVGDDPQLSQEEKLAILRRWEQDALRLSASESEGMGGGEENMLGRVKLALQRVRADQG
jgi:hypothetical protein